MPSLFFVPMSRLFGVFIVALLCQVSVALASDRPHLSSDPQVQHARELIQHGRFDEALAVLRPLSPDHPDKTDVRFLIGLAAIKSFNLAKTNEEHKTALLDEAIATLYAILIDQPGLVRVRLELARAFFLKHEDDLSREHFERVLASNSPAAMVANINQFLAIMQARRRWLGYFGISIAPDTNINAASDAEFIYINGLPFSRSADSRASSDIGVVGWGGIEYQHPLGDRLRVRIGVDVNHREYRGKSFDQTFIGGYVGPRWLLSRQTELSLLVSASQRWLGGDSFNYDVGVRLEVQRRFFPGLRASGRASWQSRQYQQQQFLEGPLMVFSLGASYVVLPTVQVNLLVGYQQQEAESDSWNNTGYWTRVGTNVVLPRGFTVGGSGEFRWTNFEGQWFPFTIDNSAREDQTRILQATLLNRAVTVYGFSPQIVFSNERRESNAQLFEFKRNRIELRFVRQF